MSTSSPGRAGSKIIGVDPSSPPKETRAFTDALGKFADDAESERVLIVYDEAIEALGGVLT